MKMIAAWVRRKTIPRVKYIIIKRLLKLAELAKITRKKKMCKEIPQRFQCNIRP